MGEEQRLSRRMLCDLFAPFSLSGEFVSDVCEKQRFLSVYPNPGR